MLSAELAPREVWRAGANLAGGGQLKDCSPSEDGRDQ
jgi:hypothetical protein